jgi:hypothetical protein
MLGVEIIINAHKEETREGRFTVIPRRPARSKQDAAAAAAATAIAEQAIGSGCSILKQHVGLRHTGRARLHPKWLARPKKYNGDVNGDRSNRSRLLNMR